MKPRDSASIRICQVPPRRWPQVREFVNSRLPVGALRLQWHSVLDGLVGGQLATAGLIEASSASPAESLLGVIWIQRQDGRVANLLMPIMASAAAQQQTHGIARELLEQAVHVAAAGGARLVQALLETDAEASAEQIRLAGFQQVAELLYLVSTPESFPTAPPIDELEFEPWSAAANDRLEAVVERSYVGTRDCPRLNGVRLTSEVLAGYRSIGPFDPARWLLVRHGGDDVGCLLLTEHPQGIWELAYMGLTPEARGHGWGLELTRHGQWLARQAGASRFVLAVDANNAPALRAYAACGLVCWDRRGAWLRILDSANAP